MNAAENNAGVIVGAGLSGLIAAHAFHGMPIVEKGARAENHKALLRFRTDKVSRLTGIPFKKVTVRKGIWYRGEFHQPNIALANLYIEKCHGHHAAGERSIWNIASAERFIAPEDFYDRLVDQLGSRIHWNTEADFKAPHPIITTAPLQVTMDAVGMATAEEFSRAPITVQRFRLPNTDLYQTIYFPERGMGVYRASITGDLLIVETVDAEEVRLSELAEIFSAFGLGMDALTIAVSVGKVRQSYGKIAPIEEAKRKWAISRLTTEHGIYSLGRFATWRNILLDDVVDDIAVIKRLITAGEYEQRLSGI